MRNILFYHKKYGVGIFVAWFCDKFVIRFNNGTEIDLPISELQIINKKDKTKTSVIKYFTKDSVNAI